MGEAERSCCIATASPRPASEVVRMLRDCPEFGSLPPHVLSVLAWSYGYSEEVPSREGFKRALATLTARAR